MNNEPVCGTGSPCPDQCNGAALGQGPATLSAARRTEKDPYCAALYLFELCQAASTILDSFPDKFWRDSGLPALLCVVEERAAALAGSLEGKSFGER